MKKMGFEKYIGFNMKAVEYLKLREEAYKSQLNVSAMLRKIVSERYEREPVEQ